MKYNELVKLLGQAGYFDLAALVQLTGERRESICIQLHRWCKDGKLLALRRGMYAFPEGGGMVAINPAELANRLYTPSYISTYWALGYYGLIPEKVVTYTSVTSRVTRSFSNALGVFSYQSLKPSVFFGYRPVMMGEKKVLIADPEKALLDLWYLEQGVWSQERMEAMRFQNQDMIDEGKLQSYAERFQSPRLVKAVGEWRRVTRSQQEGTVEL